MGRRLGVGKKIMKLDSKWRLVVDTSDFVFKTLFMLS